MRVGKVAVVRDGDNGLALASSGHACRGVDGSSERTSDNVDYDRKALLEVIISLSDESDARDTAASKGGDATDATVAPVVASDLIFCGAIGV